ncbi:hypothetical protein L1887_09751 [Cichorium endivia]|nr:hypothetical protein L1887_09751 [Cichorium endivia]
MFNVTRQVYTASNLAVENDIVPILSNGPRKRNKNHRDAILNLVDGPIIRTGNIHDRIEPNRNIALSICQGGPNFKKSGAIHEDHEEVVLSFNVTFVQMTQGMGNDNTNSFEVRPC